ncbi:MAG: hypothetical protein WAX38_04605 [Minisyncoccia bacterium]
MPDTLLGISSDIIFISGIFVLACTIAFLKGVQVVSEVGLALIVASFLTTHIGTNVVPTAITSLFSALPLTPQTLIFIGLFVFSFWATHHSNSGLDDTKRLSKVAIAAGGVTVMVIFVCTRIISLGSLVTFGPFLTSLTAGDATLFYFLCAGVVAISLSRKV